MELSLFKRKVKQSATILSTICSSGRPTEQQVREATEATGLPITLFEYDSFTLDPTRKVVVEKAFNPQVRSDHEIEEEIQSAWSWYEMLQVATN